jgi:hypothetical protein
MTPRSRSLKIGSFIATSLLILCMTLSLSPASAQNAPVERTFPNLKAEVDKAVQTLRSTTSGRLPLLDGFVGNVEYPLDRYERAYYLCAVQVYSAVTGETVVRVSAKITAWYEDPAKSKSGYQVLPSNGRLETDYLDRLEETLNGKPPAGPNTAPPKQKLNLEINAPVPRPPSLSATPPPSPRDSKPDAPPNSAPATEDDISSLRAKREAAEKRVQQLNASLKNLQDILDSQVHPSNLVAVTRAKAPVLALPEERAKVLFLAQAEDEFELIELKGPWAHVQISGASRGWLRRSDLELPETQPPSQTVAAPPKDTVLFRVVREQIGLFPGNWQPLQGKIVKVYWAQPVVAAMISTTPAAKLNFAKQLFQKAWNEPAGSLASAIGVVVVFDSSDGGQVSATLVDLKQWQEGAISEDAFWRRCSLDPPEAFGARSKQ